MLEQISRCAVSQFSGVAPLWLVLGGGGYDLQAVARAWTLAFGVLSDQYFSDQIPNSYLNTYGISQLRDTEQLPIMQSAREDARKFAERNVADLKRYVFHKHGLR